MSIYALKFQTHNFIRSMLDDGLVNEQFVYHETARLHPLRRDALLRAVTTYCLSSKGLFSAITIQLEQEQVDFERVSDLARGLYARSSSIGAERVKHACAELIQASERKDKDKWRGLFSTLRMLSEKNGSLLISTAEAYLVEISDDMPCNILKVDLFKLVSLAREMEEKSARYDQITPYYKPAFFRRKKCFFKQKKSKRKRRT